MLELCLNCLLHFDSVACCSNLHEHTCNTACVSVCVYVCVFVPLSLCVTGLLVFVVCFCFDVLVSCLFCFSEGILERYTATMHLRLLRALNNPKIASRHACHGNATTAQRKMRLGRAVLLEIDDGNAVH